MHLRNWPGVAARPALALHCMMGTAGYWGPIAADLTDLVQITAPDLPGHGQSPEWPGEPPDYHSYVTRLTAPLIRQPLDLIGHSFGATVALRIAVGAPEAVRSLTLIEPVLFAAAPDPAMTAELTALHDLVLAGHEAEATRRFLSVWGGNDRDRHAAATRARLQQQIRLVVAGNDALVHDSARILRPDGLEGIDAPVLLVMGEDSPPVIAAIAEALAARLPDVGRATVPDAGHMLPITHPQQVAGLIRLNLERA